MTARMVHAIVIRFKTKPWTQNCVYFCCHSSVYAVLFFAGQFLLAFLFPNFGALVPCAVHENWTLVPSPFSSTRSLPSAEGSTLVPYSRCTCLCTGRRCSFLWTLWVTFFCYILLIPPSRFPPIHLPSPLYIHPNRGLFSVPVMCILTIPRHCYNISIIIFFCSLCTLRVCVKRQLFRQWVFIFPSTYHIRYGSMYVLCPLHRYHVEFDTDPFWRYRGCNRQLRYWTSVPTAPVCKYLGVSMLRSLCL